ncbi:MAG: DUF1318 domain-containing protein [Deltaproteobacteria bacterium]|nr:DUF1318 domain-containing protein [Deltaproteobacteria bacterium]
MTPIARRLGRATTLLVCALLVSCITVNVNFPETAVQKAANDFVSDLYKPAPAVADNGKATATEAADVKNAVKKSSKKKTPKAPAAQPDKPTTWIFSFGVTDAFAQEVSTGSPKAQEIKGRMKGRIAELDKWKSKGAVCETADGMLVLKHPEKAGGDAGAVSQLLKAENDDRDALYAEIVDHNKIKDRNQTRVRSFFAAEFKKFSPAGTCFEN